VTRSSVGLFSIGIEPGIRDRLAAMASGRSVVIDAYREWLCGSWIGDLTVVIADGDPGPDFEALEPIDGVPVYASRRIARLLGAAGGVLRLGGLPFRRGLGLSLERPELWIDFLENPARFAPRDG
jgi:hypothetical protein